MKWQLFVCFLSRLVSDEEASAERRQGGFQAINPPPHPASTRLESEEAFPAGDQRVSPSSLECGPCSTFRRRGAAPGWRKRITHLNCSTVHKQKAQCGDTRSVKSLRVLFERLHDSPLPLFPSVSLPEVCPGKIRWTVHHRTHTPFTQTHTEEH